MQDPTFFTMAKFLLGVVRSGGHIVTPKTKAAIIHAIYMFSALNHKGNENLRMVASSMIRNRDKMPNSDDPILYQAYRMILELKFKDCL